MSMRATAVLVLALVVLSSCGDATSLSGPVVLRHNFDGHELRYKTIAETKCAEDDTLNVPSSSTLRHVSTRTSADAGYFAVTIEETSAEYDGLDGVTFRIHMNARGRVLRVTGFDDMVRDKHDARSAATILDSLDDGAMTRTQQKWQWAFPETAVKPGDRWTDEFTIAYPAGGRLDVEARMRLRKIDVIDSHQVAVIGLETEQTERDVRGGVVSERTGRGEMRFDVDLGAVRYYHMVLTDKRISKVHPNGLTVITDTKFELQE